MPTSHEWLTFMKWGDIYGGIMSVRVPVQRIIILNSPQAAVDLLEKRGAKYAYRPCLVVAGEMIGWDRALVLCRYSERLRIMRRMLAQFIGGRTQVAKFYDIINEETRRTLQRILRAPDELSEHIRKNAGAIILKIGYGYSVQDGRDPLVDIVDRSGQGFAASTPPGAFLADVVPISGWKRQVDQWTKDTTDTYDVPYEMVKAQIRQGTADTHNFVTTNFQYGQMSPANEDILKGVTASLYGGGADTTVSSVYSFFLAMVLYPDVQKRAQAEIDNVIGHDGLPTFEDRERLPYVSALCSEVLGWMPVAPLGAPHRLIEDDVYEGYHFSKGTLFVPNIWKFLHDPQTYHDPMAFKPERFLAENGRTPELDPRIYVFGFGRRICPGMHLAEVSVFVACSMALATLNITKAIVDGEEMTPSAESLTGTVSHPKPFKCTIKAKSAHAVELLYSEDH
ncbi:hypothetical protein NM688_g3738 [Phlebia brevispora]|uniref:Uncharacterized protein n=1 Tax=Phlebia brevispora TaxID=194682 RepID=A0ACC1T5J6_9APHY|nr:hypothetical protein NM688_g3738 [Phlebia brevispora]